MSCENVQFQISMMLDRQLTGGEWEQSLAHIQSCRRCGAHFESMRDMRAGLRGMAQAAPPANLTARLRVMASHERARRSAHSSISAFCRHWAGNLRLSFDNLMRPFAVPVTGGLFTALVLFSLLIPTLNPFQRGIFEEHPLAILTDPDGEIVGTTKEILRLQPGSATISGNERSLVLLIDERGHVQDFYLSDVNNGGLTDEMKSLILLSRFTPATVDGQPTWGLKQIVFPPAVHHRRLRS
jgi:hypothetical protein